MIIKSKINILLDELFSGNHEHMQELLDCYKDIEGEELRSKAIRNIINKDKNIIPKRAEEEVCPYDYAYFAGNIVGKINNIDVYKCPACSHKIVFIPNKQFGKLRTNNSITIFNVANSLHDGIDEHKKMFDERINGLNGNAYYDTDDAKEWWIVPLKYGADDKNGGLKCIDDGDELEALQGTYNGEIVYVCKNCKRKYINSPRYPKGDSYLLNYFRCYNLKLGGGASYNSFYDSSYNSSYDSDYNDQAESNDQSSSSSWYSNTREKKYIGTGDFVVVSNIYSCASQGHYIKNIDAQVAVKEKKGIFNVILAASYCEVCHKFYLTTNEYERLCKIGKPLCKIIGGNYAEYVDSNFDNNDGFAEKSFLTDYGYSVAKNNGLSYLARREILAEIIDSGEHSKGEIVSHLNTNINLRKGQAKYRECIQKWRDDIAFVNRYKIGEYERYGINSLKI